MAYSCPNDLDICSCPIECAKNEHATVDQDDVTQGFILANSTLPGNSKVLK